MNLAIIIGNSDYEYENKLPACENDVAVIEQIINKSGKYDEILTLVNYDSTNLKNCISEKIKSLEGVEVSEIFLYYTGHGLYKDQQFFYIPIDYNEKKHNRTSFSNEECDNLLKSLSPHLTVKVIDACESSQSYIKMMRDETQKYLNKTTKNFEDCYFMFSSLNNQSSYQNKSMSFFTKAFIESLIEHKNTSIRYQDIISYIADSFDNSDNQTPFFVTQAKYTDVFIDNLDIIKKTLNNLGTDLQKDENKEIRVPNIAMSLKDSIENESKLYLDKEMAIKAIEQIGNDIFSIKIVEALDGLFDLSIQSVQTISTIIGIKKIFKEIESKQNEMYITIEKEEEDYQVEIEVPKRRNRNAISSMAFFLNTYQEFDLKTVTRTREKIVGFEHSLPTSTSGFQIKLIPKFENLNMFTENIFFIFNKKEFILYSNLIEYFDKNWGQWVVKEIHPWQKREYQFTSYEEILNGIKKVIAEMQDIIFDKYKKIYKSEN